MMKENLIKRDTLSCNHMISLETGVISRTSIGRMIFRNDPIVINQSWHDTTVCWHCQAHARFTSRILELKIVNLCIKKKMIFPLHIRLQTTQEEIQMQTFGEIKISTYHTSKCRQGKTGEDLLS